MSEYSRRYLSCIGEELIDLDAEIDVMRAFYKKIDPMLKQFAEILPELHKKGLDALKELDLAAAREKKEQDFQKDLP